MKTQKKSSRVYKDFRSVVFDLDETLAPTQSPMSLGIVRELVYLLRSGAYVALITLQSVDEVKNNFIEPIHSYLALNNIDSSNLWAYIYCCGGATGYRYSFQNKLFKKYYENELVLRNSDSVKLLIESIASKGELIDRKHSISFHYYHKDRENILTSLGHQLRKSLLPVDVIKGFHFFPKNVDKAYAVKAFIKAVRAKPSEMLIVGDSFGKDGSDWGMYIKGALCISVRDYSRRKGLPVLAFSHAEGYIITEELLKERRCFLMSQRLLFQNVDHYNKWFNGIKQITGKSEDVLISNLLSYDKNKIRFARFGLVPEELCSYAHKLSKVIGKRQNVFLGHGTSASYEAYKAIANVKNSMLVRFPRFDIERNKDGFIASHDLSEGFLSLLSHNLRSRNVENDHSHLLEIYRDLPEGDKIILNKHTKLFSGHDFISLVSQKGLTVEALVKSIFSAGIDSRLIDYSRLLKEVSIFDFLIKQSGSLDQKKIVRIQTQVKANLKKTKLLSSISKNNIVRAFNIALKKRLGSTNFWDINFEYFRLIMNEYGLKGVLANMTHSSRSIISYFAKKEIKVTSFEVVVVDDACATGSSFISATIIMRSLMADIRLKYITVNSVACEVPYLVDHVIIKGNVMYQETFAETFSLLFGGDKHEKAVYFIPPVAKISFDKLKNEIKVGIDNILAVSPGRVDIPFSAEEYVLAYLLGDKSEFERRFLFEFIFNDYHNELFQVNWTKRQNLEREVEILDGKLSSLKSANDKKLIKHASVWSKKISQDSYSLMVKRRKEFLAELRTIA